MALFKGGGPFIEGVAGDHDLRGDLLRGEIAHEGLRAGMAEGAVQRTADLGRDAERPAIHADAGDVDAFAFDAGGKARQPFLGAVFGNLMIGDLRAVQRETRGQFGAQLLADIGHALKAGGAEILAPARDLLGPHGGLLGIKPHGLKFCLQRRQGHSGEGTGALRLVGRTREIECDCHEIAL